MNNNSNNIQMWDRAVFMYILYNAQNDSQVEKYRKAVQFINENATDKEFAAIYIDNLYNGLSDDDKKFITISDIIE